MDSPNKLFTSGDLLGPEAVDIIFDRESKTFGIDLPGEPDEVIAERRSLLGPTVDITHPDFDMSQKNE